MIRPTQARSIYVFTGLAGALLWASATAADAPAKAEGDEPIKLPPHSTTIVAKPKPLTRNVTQGLAYLAKQQREDGGWSAGMNNIKLPGIGIGIPAVRPGVKGRPGIPGVAAQAMPEEESDVGDTCIAGLCFLRAGSRPDRGTYSKHLIKAIDFVCTSVEKADDESLSVTDLKTQIQRKIGTHADTFLALWFLAEVKGSLPNATTEQRVDAALAKILAKMKANQGEDGSWTGEGWAPILSQALAAMAINRARQVGVPVDETVLARASENAMRKFEKAAPEKAPAKPVKGPRAVPGGVGAPGFGFGFPFAGGARADAGISLYSSAAEAGAMLAVVQTNRQLGQRARSVLDSPNSTEEERREAKTHVLRFEQSQKAMNEVNTQLTKRLFDPLFQRGFGSDGGEEYLSFMILGQTLLAQNNTKWKTWDRTISSRIEKAQNKDGSWSGQHCISGSTFCTATALMTLMSDRTPVPAPVRAAR
jgi:hypothetical protein